MGVSPLLTVWSLGLLFLFSPPLDAWRKSSQPPQNNFGHLRHISASQGKDNLQYRAPLSMLSREHGDQRVCYTEHLGRCTPVVW